MCVAAMTWCECACTVTVTVHLHWHDVGVEPWTEHVEELEGYRAGGRAKVEDASWVP